MDFLMDFLSEPVGTIFYKIIYCLMLSFYQPRNLKDVTTYNDEIE